MEWGREAWSEGGKHGVRVGSMEWGKQGVKHGVGGSRGWK